MNFYELVATNDEPMATNRLNHHALCSEDRGSGVGVHDRVHIMACFIS